MIVDVSQAIELGEDTIRQVLVAGLWIDVKKKPRALRESVNGWVEISEESGMTLVVRQEAVQAVRAEYRKLPTDR